MIRPIATITMNIISPVSKVVSINARAISIGIKVPDVLSPIKTLSSITTKAPKGTRSICLYAFCSEIGKEKSEKSRTAEFSIMFLLSTRYLVGT